MSRFDVINAERLVSSIDNRFAVHNIYNGLEDAMADLAGAIDNHVPHGARSHQRSLDQMHVALENRRPVCLDDALNRDLAKLASEEKLTLVRSVLPFFVSGLRSNRRLHVGGLKRAKRNFTFLHLRPLRPKHAEPNLSASQSR